MNNKCTKFGSLFVFSNKSLEKHLEECEDCRHEKEKLDKVSSLIQEARPLYLMNKRKRRKNMVCAAAFLFIVLSATILSSTSYVSAFFDTIKYGETLSAEDYGFPVDSYGFIMVDE